MKKNKGRAQKGQVTIFLIFIFHVLFLFFAMVINVGVLVHQKINLQNSVDLAAYYGAMKQAQMLGAIGHVNYQIRQSWKLLNFRYWVIGGMGRDSHPANTSSYTGPLPPPDTKNDLDIPVFCIVVEDIFQVRDHAVVDPQSLCKLATKAIDISGIYVPNNIGAGLSFDANVTATVSAAQLAAVNDFAKGGLLNYQMLGEFILHYRDDVKNRRLVIDKLARQLSEGLQDFKDVRGESVNAGAKETLKNNLTEDNRRNLEDTNYSSFKFYNSMGDPSCKAEDSDGSPSWLRPIIVLPEFFYYDSTSWGQGVGSTVIHHGETRPVNFLPQEAIKQGIGQALFQGLTQFILPSPPAAFKLNDLVGFEKNPWCLTYVGVKASTAPYIPFMPTQFSVQLKAEAYAKPFGGKIGPWFMKTWGPADSQSTGSSKLTQIDRLLPMRRGPNSSTTGLPESDVVPRYARYPGDIDGIDSRQVQYAYGRAMRATVAQKGPFNFYTAYTLKIDPPAPSSLQADYPLIPPDFDILATKNTGPANAALRNYELAAIAPDLFDIAYYSIEPDYLSLYYPYLSFNFSGSPLVRPDLGDTIKNNMTVVEDNTNNIDFLPSGVYHTVSKRGNGGGTIWGRVLTNWSEQSLLNYSIDEVKDFGICKGGEDIDTSTGIQATQGECLGGGRTGYSVKLVSKKYLERTDLNLGLGPTGKIKNPPPQW